MDNVFEKSKMYIETRFLQAVYSCELFSRNLFGKVNVFI